MTVSAEDIKTLRARSQAGMLDCKKALEACDNDMEKAIAWLREKGKALVAKKEGRIAAEGIVESYIHLGGKIGVLVEVNCETDFVAKGEKLKELAHNICLQIAASKPLFVDITDVDGKALEEEKKIFLAQALNEGKPQQVAEKIVEGKVKKYYKEVCLLEQEYFREPSKTIRELVNDTIIVLGEKITVRRFTRYEMGEGLQKRSDDFADEVQKQCDCK